jgi:hypothetical protein
MFGIKVLTIAAHGVRLSSDQPRGPRNMEELNYKYLIHRRYFLRCMPRSGTTHLCNSVEAL